MSDRIKIHCIRCKKQISRIHLDDDLKQSNLICNFCNLGMDILHVDQNLDEHEVHLDELIEENNMHCPFCKDSLKEILISKDEPGSFKCISCNKLYKIILK